MIGDDIQEAVAKAFQKAGENGNRPVSEQACSRRSGEILTEVKKVGESVSGLQAETIKMQVVLQSHLGEHRGLATGASTGRARIGTILAIIGSVVGGLSVVAGAIFGIIKLAG